MTKCVVLLSLVLAAACRTPPEQPSSAPPPGDDRARELADAYLGGYFERNPELVTYYGVRGRRHDRLSDNSPDALKAWRSKEDAWLREAQTIEPATIAAAPLKATY